MTNTTYIAIRTQLIKQYFENVRFELSKLSESDYYKALEKLAIDEPVKFQLYLAYVSTNP